MVVGAAGDQSFGGVRIDGLISHAFLKRFVWTIDFDTREYRFASHASNDSERAMRWTLRRIEGLGRRFGGVLHLNVTPGRHHSSKVWARTWTELT